MKKESIQIADRTCTIYKYERPEYLLIQPIDEHDLEVLDNEVAMIQSLTNKSFTLVAFEIKDWQSELTPWTAPAVFGKIPFGDGAVATLSFIKDILIPQLEQMQLFDTDKMQCVLGGYSLAGFFSLWSAYQTELFDGVAAVSPSVWYPLWMEYAKNNKPLASSVYLSLGDKEEKTKNSTMAQVGNCIRSQQELLTAQGINTILEWNPGNHFQHSDERTAKGFAWLLITLSEPQ
ncbi:MAG: esterase [Bacteroidaceae bacterium]|nr:esterase [Bacteroidaceae bacterium]